MTTSRRMRYLNVILLLSVVSVAAGCGAGDVVEPQYRWIPGATNESWLSFQPTKEATGKKRAQIIALMKLDGIADHDPEMMKRICANMFNLFDSKDSALIDALALSVPHDSRDFQIE